MGHLPGPEGDVVHGKEEQRRVCDSGPGHADCQAPKDNNVPQELWWGRHHLWGSGQMEKGGEQPGGG